MIRKYAFNNTSIKSLKIPTKLKEIGPNYDGRLGIGRGRSEAAEFTEISSLSEHKTISF